MNTTDEKLYAILCELRRLNSNMEKLVEQFVSQKKKNLCEEVKIYQAKVKYSSSIHPVEEIGSEGEPKQSEK